MAKHMRFQQMNKTLWFCRIESVARIFFLVLGMFVLHFFTVCVCVQEQLDCCFCGWCFSCFKKHVTDHIAVKFPVFQPQFAASAFKFAMFPYSEKKSRKHKNHVL